MLLIKKFLYIYYFFFLKKIPHKTLLNRLKPNFYINNSVQTTKPIITNKLFNLIFSKNIGKFIVIIQNIFYLNKNVLFIDYNYNYNYLPITNKTLFSRSSKFFNKVIKYFDVSLVLFLNLNKKKFFLKKLFCNNTINVSFDKNTFSKKFDLNLNSINNNLTCYIFYILVINIYLKVKK